MLPELLVEKIQFELTQIAKEIDDVNPLLQKVALQKPDAIEIRAVASVLHSFYNGVENILGLIIKEADGTLPDNHRWHTRLLEIAAQDVSTRRKIISNKLKESLEDYLGFRHFFRHSYGFYLDWDLMEPLVLNMSETMKRLKKDIESFLYHRQ